MRHHERVRPFRHAAGPTTWLLSTAVATAIAWWAVTAAGARGEEPGAVLSQAEVAAALAAERDALAAAATTAPGVTPSAEPVPQSTPEPGPTAEPAAPVVRTWSLEEGVVSAFCSGDVVSLEYATPASGWRVDVKERGPGTRVLVELEREGIEQYVQAVCVAGTPEYTLVDDGSDEEEHRGTGHDEGED